VNRGEQSPGTLAEALARIESLERELDDLKRLGGRFGDFADVAADWFWEMDAELRFTWISESVERLTGASRDWYYGKTRDQLLDRVPDPEGVDEHLRTLREHRPFKDFVYQRAGGGEPVWVSTNGKPIFDEGGRFTGYRGSATEVTARVAAERALRRSEERLRDFARVSSDWFWEMGPDLRYTYFSDSVVRYHGVPPEFYYGKSRDDLRAPGDDAEAWEAHSRLLDEREPYRDFVLKRRLADGSVRYVKSNGVPLFSESGEFLGYRGTGSDITDQVEAEHALQESEAMLRAILDNLPSMLSLKDPRGRLQLANRAWLVWHGVSLDEARGKTMAEFLPKRLADAVQADDRLVVESGEVVHDELDAVGVRGVWRTFLTQRFPVLGPGGEVRAVGAFSTDITERKRNEDELARHRRHLEELVRERTRELEEAHDELVQNERLATLGQIIGTVSHELRNPLGTIQTSAYTLRSQAKSPPPAMLRSLERIERSIRRCVIIIEELLAYSRVRPLVRVPVRLGGWVDAVLAELDLPEGVRLETELDSDAVVRIDPERLQQALVNVCQNAYQAIAGDDEHGAGAVGVRAAVDGRTLNIRVSDTGPGIPDEILGRVFEPLFSTKSFGFGLGMPLVQQIAEQHQGEVKVESRPGVGTTVILNIALPED
jgi:PAS domain S-box-containing protein